jgi:hypothetical protein
MSTEHFANFGRICGKEGLGRAMLYDFDKSSLRLLIPYTSELVPGFLGFKNYKTLMSLTEKQGKFIDGVKKVMLGGISLGSEAARYIITAVTYNETKSPTATLLAYSLSTSFFSARNQLRVDRFFKPRR